MRIIWEVEDGYCGRSRPHHTEIPDKELEGLTEDEQDEAIEEYVREDFFASISYSWYRE